MKIDTEAVAQLTQQALAPDAAPDVIHFDDDLAGFGLRLRRGAGGRVRASYVAQYRTHGRTRRMKIGAVETLSAEQARKAAKKELAKVVLGDDPQGDKIKARLKAAHTLRALADDYLAAREGELRPASYHVTNLYLTGPYFKPLHAIGAAEVTQADVAGRLTAIKKANGTVTAGRARAALSAMYKWAMGEGMLGPNPVNPVANTNRPADATPRERVLEDDELAAVWRACGDDDHGRIVKLLALTGCRRNEIGNMRWSELSADKRTLTLPPERTKNNRKHAVPLADVASEIIRMTPQRLGRDPVFGGGRGNGFTNWAKNKTALDRRLGAEVKPWRLHDLRRTCATRMADIGVLPHIIEAALNHYSGHRRGVAGIYNKSDYKVEVRAALIRWADRIQEIVERPRLRKTQ